MPPLLQKIQCFSFPGLPLIDSTSPCPADDFQSSASSPLAGGIDSLLTEEDDDEFFDLHIVKHEDKEVSRRSPHGGGLGDWKRALPGAVFSIMCSAEGGGFLGLHGPRVSPAESGDSVRPEGVPDGQGGAPAQPPRPHAARPQEAHLCQRRGEAGQWLQSVFTQWPIKFPTFDRTRDSRCARVSPRAS